MGSVDVQDVWNRVNAVCFDVDSTVCIDEGLDEFAAFCGVGEKVAEWTNKAMGGSVTFREALSERLKIIQPTRNQLSQFLESHPPKLTPGVKALVELLHSRKVDVYLVSGGFKSIIEPIAKELNVPIDNIYANRFKFYYDGSYAGFDEDAPTSESGGKPSVVKLLKEKCNYTVMAMIGDGATDMEASPPADLFIGFGGNKIRESVKSKAPWFVMDFKTLIDALK
ncbi:phosphoserine phosphatase-like isoform X2 [Lineus longissimus]